MKPHVAALSLTFRRADVGVHQVRSPSSARFAVIREDPMPVHRAMLNARCFDGRLRSMIGLGR